VQKQNNIVIDLSQVKNPLDFLEEENLNSEKLDLLKQLNMNMMLQLM